MSTVAWPLGAAVRSMSRLTAGVAAVTVATALATLTWPNGGIHQTEPDRLKATPTTDRAYAGFLRQRWPRLVALAAASDTRCFAHPTQDHRRRRSAPTDINQQLRVGACLTALRREDRVTRRFLDDLARQQPPNAFSTATTRFASAVRANLLLNTRLVADLTNGDVTVYNDTVRMRMPPAICIGPINHLIGATEPSQQLPQAILTNC
jgi:hypothetical protein